MVVATFLAGCSIYDMETLVALDDDIIPDVMFDCPENGRELLQEMLTESKAYNKSLDASRRITAKISALANQYPVVHVPI